MIIFYPIFPFFAPPPLKPSFFFVQLDNQKTILIWQNFYGDILELI